MNGNTCSEARKNHLTPTYAICRREWRLLVAVFFIYPLKGYIYKKGGD